MRFESNSGNNGKVHLTGKGYSTVVESTHEYVDYSRAEGCVEIEGVDTLTVKFDSSCTTENSCDWLAFYKTQEDLSSQTRMNGCYFTGSDIANKEIKIPSNKFYWKWHTDSSGTRWGYKFTVEAGGQAMSKGQRASLYTALAAYGSACKVAASCSPAIVPLVYNEATCEVLTKAAETTTGQARQQLLAILSQMMMRRGLFGQAPKLERFQGLRTVLAKAQKVYDDTKPNSSGPISALLSLFACLDHPTLDTTTWEHKGRIRFLPAFTRTSTVACLKPPTVAELADLYAEMDIQVDVPAEEEASKEPVVLAWPAASDQVEMIMGIAGYERAHVEYCLIESEGSPDATCEMLMEGEYIAEMPDEQELIKQVTGQGAPAEAEAEAVEAALVQPKPKKTMKVTDEQKQAAPNMDNALFQQQPLCAIAPYFEAACFIQAANARLALGLRKKDGRVVLSFDTYGSLFVLKAGVLELTSHEMPKSTFSSQKAVGMAICYDQYGHPTGEITIVGADKLDKAKYVNLHTVTIEDASELYPFVTLADHSEIEDPEMNIISVSRIPNAGAVEPLLPQHPQLLQAPIAQLRAIGSVATAIKEGQPLPKAFRMITPHEADKSPDLRGFVSSAGMPHGHSLTDSFRGGAFVVSLACATNCVAKVTLKAATEKSSAYVVQIGPERQIAICSSKDGQQDVLAQGSLPDMAKPTFQTITAKFIADLVQSDLDAAFHAGSTCDHEADLNPLFDANVGQEMVMKTDFLLSALRPLENQLGLQLADFGISNATYFSDAGKLPLSGLTVSLIATHLHELFQSDAADSVMQVAVWVRLVGSTIQMGTGETFYGGPKHPTCVCADIGEASKCLSVELDSVPQIQGVEFSSMLEQAEGAAAETSEVSAEHTWKEEGPLGMKLTQRAMTPQQEGGVYVEDAHPQLPADLKGMVIHNVAGEEVLNSSYDDVIAKIKAADKPLTIQFSKRWSMTHTWHEVGAPLGLKLTELGGKDDATEGVYVEDAAPFVPQELKGLMLERVADLKVSDKGHDEIMTLLKAASRPLTLEFTKPLGNTGGQNTAPCKWKIQSHGSQKYLGLDSPFVFMYRDGQSHDVLPATMAEDTAELPDGWNMSMDKALAQFCSKHNGKLGTMEQLQTICQSTNGQQVFAPLLRLCGSEFPAVIRIRAESMSHISKMALGVINVLPFGDPDHVLLHSFSTLAPLVFASDKKPAIDAAMAQFSPPSADKPDLSLDRFALMEAGDASGDNAATKSVCVNSA